MPRRRDAPAIFPHVQLFVIKVLLRVMPLAEGINLNEAGMSGGRNPPTVPDDDLN
jgi:hypothetical protein